MLWDSSSSRWDMVEGRLRWSDSGAARGRLVDPAFPLETEESSLLRSEVGCQRAAGMNVADRDVALLPKGVIRKPVQLEKAMHVPVAPLDDRVNLHDSVLDAHDGQPLATPGLGPAEPG